MRIKIQFIIIILIGLALFSCKPKNRFQVDLEKERVRIKINRFDQDLIRLDTANLDVAIDSLFAEYSVFLPFFIENMTNSSIENKDTIGKLLTDFVNYPQMKEVNQKVLEKFKDISGIKKEVSEAFTYIHHFFPNLTLPQLYFYISGLNVPMIMNADRTILGVGTDFYLGKDFAPYKGLVYDYMLQNMTPEHLPIDIISAIIFSNFGFDSKHNRLLDNMLYRAKGLYLLSVSLPNRATNEIVGYNPEQEKWAETHEKEIWKSIVSQKDLFSSDQHLIRKYMQEAPFTAPISHESPGRLGEWIGLRILESYMNENKNVTLPELMKMNDYQKILEKSAYN